MVGGALGDPDDLLETQGDEAGEEKGAERVDVEGDEVLGDGRARVAGGFQDKVVGIGGVPGQADEDG